MMMRLGWLKDYTRPLWDHNIEAESTLKCSCAWKPRSLKTCCPSVSMHLSISAQSWNLLREKLARKTVICWWVRGVEKWWRKWENIPFYNMSSLWIKHFQFSSVQFSRWVVSDSLRPHELQHARPPCPSPNFITEFTQTCVHRVGDAIQPSHPLSSPSPPAPNPSQHHSLFKWVNSLHDVAKTLEFQLQHQSFQRNPRANLLQNGLVGSPCSPRDSQESSPISQFKSINSSALSLLHSPTLTSIHDHRKNHNLD